MALKLKRETLERIVYEELQRYFLRSLNEAPPGRGTVLDDEDDDVPKPEDAPEEQLPTDDVDAEDPAASAEEPPEDMPGDQPAGEEPADDDLAADVAGDEEPEAEPGSVAAELEGKTIDTVSMEEESKIMPGAQEIVFTFHEVPEALRFLVTKTGKVKIFYKGLHNELESPVEQIPGEEEPEDLGMGEPGEEPGEEMPPEETEEEPPLGDEDMPPPPEEEEPEELP
jgi:hypothetical protein